MYVTAQDPIGLLGGDKLYGYVHDPNELVDVFGLMAKGFMNGASAKITVGDVSKTFKSSGTGHAEINGLNWFDKNVGFSGQNVEISEVTGHFRPSGDYPVGMCTGCRTNMFEVLQKGNASSVTIPVTKGNVVLEKVTIPAENFAKVEAELNTIRNGTGSSRKKSDTTWETLKRNGTCH